MSAGWTRIELATSGVTGRCSNLIELPPQFELIILRSDYLSRFISDLYKMAIGIIMQYPITKTTGAIFTD